MDDTEWHRIFNIIDARHDGNKCSGVRGPSIKDDKLFKDALILLFGESVTNDKPHFANDNGRYYMEVLEGQNIVNPFTRAILVEGQQDNMLPTRFNMRSMMTLSQLYDPAPFTYSGAKPLGFGNIDRRDIHLDAYGFTNWSLNATWTDTSAQTEFKLHTSPIKANKLNFRITVDSTGRKTKGNQTNPLSIVSNYIAGNTEKNEAINSNNRRYQIARPVLYSQAELYTYINEKPPIPVDVRQIFNSAVGRIASKVVGDLGHFFTDYPVCSTDNYLALRGARLRKACILRHSTGNDVTFRYFPGGANVMADEAFQQTDNVRRGVQHRVRGGVFNRLVGRVFGVDLQDSHYFSMLGNFGWHHVEHTRVCNAGPVHDDLLNNNCMNVNDLHSDCNRTTNVATCYADHTTGEGVIIVNPHANGVYSRTRSRTLLPPTQMQYTDEYLETPNLLLNGVSTVLVGLCIAVVTHFMSHRLHGGEVNMPMKEEVSKHSDMKLNQQKRYLSSEYDKYISHLTIFLTVNKVRISGENEEETCPAHIVTYINNVIAMFTAHKESALESVKTDEDIFRWVPSQIIFHTDFMKIPQYTEGPAYYAPLKVPKLFPHLDDATVLKSFKLENKFGAYSTFYDFFTGSLDVRPAYVIPDTPLVFKDLLIFLDGEYSYNKKVEDMTDEIPTNFGDGGVKFAEQIRWFQTNGVTLENSQIFAALLADTMSRQCIGATQLAPIIFNELAKGDIILGYTLYNQCYPHLFASTKYFIRFDIYADLVHQLNSSDEIKHDLLYVIESKLQQDYANSLHEHVTGLASKLGITTDESLYEYCRTLTVTEKDFYEFGDTISELLVYPSGASPVFLEQFSKISNQICRIIEEKNKQRVYPNPEKSVEKNPIRTMKFKRPEEESPEEESPEEESPEGREELPPPPPRLLKIGAHGGRKTVKRIKKHSKRVNNKHKKPTRRKTVKRKH